MNKPHKHAEAIKAWADGAEIEFRSATTKGEWWLAPAPNWNGEFEYRVKPQPKKYKVDVWLCFRAYDGYLVRVLHGSGPDEFTQSRYHVIHHTLEGELPNV